MSSSDRSNLKQLWKYQIIGDTLWKKQNDNCKVTKVDYVQFKEVNTLKFHM